MYMPMWGCAHEGGEDGCCLSPAAVKVRERFRMLWEQHVFWTRMVITGIAFDSPDLEATTNRLLRNATDFGRMFARFYGKEAGEEFARLVRDHLVIAAELVRAAKAGDTQAAAQAEERWYANGDEIVRFLYGLNRCWSLNHMRVMWREHLAMTKEEAVAILSGEYAKSVTIFDRVERQALKMADEFSEGILDQFCL